MNKPTISTIIASAALAIASSARKTSGNKNQGVTIKTIDELYRYANDPKLAKTVTKVFLSRNRISEIPKEIGNLINLKQLYLRHHQIQSPTQEELMYQWIPSGFSPKVAELIYPLLPSQQTSIRRY